MNATYHLELLLAGSAAVTVTQKRCLKKANPLEPVMDRLAETSRSAYERLMSTEGFFTFFRQATPIDVIESSRFGSRPARRTGCATIADLRAIPWVFSWSQARYYLSGWFGIGSALEQLLAEDETTFRQLVAESKTWKTLHYIVGNVATSIATANLGIMSEYATLVENDTIRERMFSVIHDEYLRTTRMLEIIYGGPLSKQRPRIHSALARREDALMVLHLRQIEMLRQWRSYLAAGDINQADGLLLRLLETINAIAAGLRTTG
jgi:phosphoenolpyruvate carboxylase